MSGPDSQDTGSPGATDESAPKAHFLDADFDTFAPHKHRDELFNEERRRLKGRLKLMGERVQKHLKKKKLPLELRTSLSHPYTYNGFKVDSMWFYLARPAKDRRALKDLMGPELGQDLDPNYLHLVLAVAIDHTHIEIAFRIHERAWWDTQNLKNKCEGREGAQAFAETLNPLEGFSMFIHDWKKEYPCASASWGDIGTFMMYFKPGEHRLTIRKRIPRGDPRAVSAELIDEAAEWFEKGIPLYRFVSWSPENNHLGLGSR